MHQPHLFMQPSQSIRWKGAHGVEPLHFFINTCKKFFSNQGYIGIGHNLSYPILVPRYISVSAFFESIRY
ncbi:hypothetical protein MSMTP_1416 [Methanosarcina sp. MTP4]|nr:hypothetical protein MSMTP_1416 [Methanosarcina sp. MTP4]